jgi:hypothetical protein
VRRGLPAWCCGAILGLVFERFTPEAREVVVAAHQEARDLRHSQIDTEHLLLGVLADRKSRASHLLKGFGITPKRAREQIVQIEGRGETPVEGMMPFTSSAKKVLSLSLREAVTAGSRVVTPEYLLCGLLRVEEGVAVRVLLDLNARPTDVREALAPLLQVPNPPGPPLPRAFAPRPVFVRSDSVMTRLIEACTERAIDDVRTEYGLREFLAVIAEDEEAAAIIMSLGIDIQSLRQLEDDRPADAAA